jgi:hypothetical protein
MASEKKERIFISYKRVDKERVFAIKDGIEQATGEKCWIDLDGIESNAQFVAKIVRAIDVCDVFLFMRSKEHSKITNLETDWTIREVNYALEEHKNIVIVNLDNMPMPKWFKFMFPNKQEIDATDPNKLARLNNDLREWLGISPKAIQQSENIETYTSGVPSQPTVVQDSAEFEKAKRDALLEGEFQVDDLIYKASENSSGLTVCGLINNDATEIHIPSQIQYGNYTYYVDTIGNKAFDWHFKLTSINIPNSVKSIGDEAFSRCSGLTSITIPNSVTNIGTEAFRGCSSLTSITIPNSVTTIKFGAFYGCYSLISVTIPYGVTSIEAWAFDGCKSLTSVSIPNSVTEIGEYAFNDCSNLTSVTIGNSVTSIGRCAFRGSKALKSIKIPKSVINIGTFAFPIFTKKIRE